MTQVFSISRQGNTLRAADLQLTIGPTAHAWVAQVPPHQQSGQHEQDPQTVKRACQQGVELAVVQLRMGNGWHAGPEGRGVQAGGKKAVSLVDESPITVQGQVPGAQVDQFVQRGLQVAGQAAQPGRPIQGTQSDSGVKARRHAG